MRFDLDQLQELRVALARNKLRTFLTAFGVFWGLFLLVLMHGSGQGLWNGVSRDFAGTATNSLFVWSWRTGKPWAGFPAGREIQLVNADVEAVRRSLPDAAIVSPRLQLRGYGRGNNVTRGARAGAFSVMGDEPAIRFIQSIPLTNGRFLNDLDLVGRRKVAVVGQRVVELLFASGEDPIGEWIRINGVDFQVVGIFGSLRSGDDGERERQTIYLPFTTFQRAFNMGERVGWLAITARDGVPASRVEEQVLAFLKARHHIAPDDPRGLGHWNMEKEYDQISDLFAGIRALVWIVGIGTLAAGVIGVSNIMLVIVKERTKELGIRRAVGATPWSITTQIVTESLVLTSLAGWLGLVAGLGVLAAVRLALPPQGAGMLVAPDVGSGTALAALAVLVVSGVLAGLLPARRAVRMNTVEALRST